MNCPDDKTQQVLLEVRYERQRQTEKFGQESHPDGVGLDLDISGTAEQCMNKAKAACDDSANDNSITFWDILFE